MNTNFEDACRHLRERAVAFEAHPEERAIVSSFDLRNTTVRFVGLFPADQPFFNLFLILPVTVMPDRRAAVGEVLHRLNWNLTAGHFELDYDTGTVRLAYPVRLPEAGQDLDEDAFQLWLLNASAAVDSLCPAILKVAFSAVSPIHAVEQSEAEVLAYLQSLGEKSGEPDCRP